MGKVNGRWGDFQPPPTAQRPLNRFSLNREYMNTSRILTFRREGGGAMSTLVVLANSQFDAWKFLSFILHQTHTGRIFGHTNAMLYRVVQKSKPLSRIIIKSY